VNERFARLVGRPTAEIVGRTSMEIGFWADPADRKMMLQALQREGSVRDMEIVMQRRSGEVLSLLLSAVEVEFDGQRCLLALCYDVTELQMTERALRESEANLRKAQEVARLGSWTIDFGGADQGASWSPVTDRVFGFPGPEPRLSWSPETHRVFGTDPDSFVPSVPGLLELVHRDDRAALDRAVEATLTGGASYDVEHRIVRPDGTVRWVRERAEVLRDEQGTVVRVVGTVQDVTDRRQLERQLAQSQKMEAVGRLAGGVAHDFNNLLSVILGYGELLARKIDASDLRGKAGEIVKAAERAAALTRQLLAFSRRQVMVAESLDLTQVVAGISSMLQRLIGEDVELQTVLHPGAGHVRADRSQIEQVIVNLAVNARDAMPRGGKLVIEVQDMELGRPYVRDQLTVPAAAYVTLSVSDSGVGMDAETRGHVFEPFFTTKAEGGGTGLGLATVYGIVKQSGGYVWVDSEPGRGTSFRIYLPRVRPEFQPTVAEGWVPGEAPRGSERILVVEDEEALRKLTCEVLRSLGYEVIEASNGRDALDNAQREGGRIDLLLTDVVMPGLNGRELAEKLGADHGSLKVLYMSGYTDDVVLRQGVLTEGTAFIQKPFAPDVLARRVRAVLDAASAPSLEGAK
jgi:two-component system, cell cycle sensor histidine kinase and response regulator CckA